MKDGETLIKRTDKKTCFMGRQERSKRICKWF